jgi:RNA polymerase sigma factor (TIGR02999 family)
MSASSPQEITRLLIDWSNGNQAAFAQLMPLVHDELRRIAHRYMRHERAGHVLQTSALINEAYLRLVNCDDIQWQERAQFFAIAAQVMRHIQVDYARANLSAKRDGDTIQITLHEVADFSNAPSLDVLALNEAMEKLAAFDERKSKVIELQFFGGLNNEETAQALGISVNTVLRDRNLAKAWLYRELSL